KEGNIVLHPMYRPEPPWMERTDSRATAQPQQSSTQLPVWQRTLYIVYASRKFVPLKIRTFADFLLLELARREETRQRRCAPLLGVGVSTTNGSSRSRLAFMAPVA